jgi:signal peptidase I
MHLRLAAAFAGIASADLLRALLGATCFFAYAASTSVPQLRWTYAEIVAGSVVPHGHAYEIVDVKSSSMSPPFSDGSIVAVDYSAYVTEDPQVGDVVAVTVPRRNLYIKRVVALPGDAFSIDQGQVLTDGRTPFGWDPAWSPSYDLTVANFTIKVDGLPLDRSVAHIPLPALWSDASRLPQDCYFVLGDNVNDSEDSHVFGCVPERDIVGEVTRVL